MVLIEGVFLRANVAQLVELLICNQLVGGSSPSVGSTINIILSGSSSVGRASAFQAECREFEPRLPLHFFMENRFAHVAQLVERFLGKEEVHRFDSGHGLHRYLKLNSGLGGLNKWLNKNSNVLSLM